jgi:ABC-type transport system involved in multi-copper enzyme maturation permease subunit
MNPTDPIFVGIKAFLGWTVLSACCFGIAAGAARLVASVPRQIYVVRLVFMFLLLIVWGACVPAMASAFIGNGADPQNANRHARWEAKNVARFYGAHTIWPWCLVALLDRPKGKARETQSC